MFRYSSQQYYVGLLKRLSLNNPKILFKQVEDEFPSDNPILIFLPLLFLLKIKSLSEKKVTFRFAGKKLEVKVGDCRDFEKRHTDIVSSIRKLINREKA